MSEKDTSDYPTELLEGETEFVFFVYDDTPEDPRYSLWAQRDDWGVSLYDHTPQGVGIWNKLERDSDYDAETPTETLREMLGEYAAGDRIDVRWLDDLPPHERHFVKCIHGTVNGKEEAVPEPVIRWLSRLADEYGPQ